MSAQLSLNALSVLRQRYLLRDERGRVVETPEGMFSRVARAVAAAEEMHGDSSSRWERVFYNAMSSLEFLPNSPCLMNAGARPGQLAACFVLPVEDSLEGIFTSLKDMALVQQGGGGCGYDFSRLRPAGDVVRSTAGAASGPLGFLRLFDAATDAVKQGGRRRGANMGILRCDHPDVLDFISSKRQGGLRNFNISVGVTDAFMKAAEEGRSWSLINPRSGKAVFRVKAKDVFDSMVDAAWETGDPGLVFLDEINRHNPTPALGAIEATNPCSEQPLLPFESCVLGSVNLNAVVKEKHGIPVMDWAKLKELSRLAVRFLDDVIDVNHYPVKEIARVTKASRKAGVGVMGFADLLARLGIAYDSEEALQVGEKIMLEVSKETHSASHELALARGVFPNWEKSVWHAKGIRMRNATTTTVAPTGSISIIAGCSGGIEPFFAISFERHVLEGRKLAETVPSFLQAAEKQGLGNNLISKVARTGSARAVKELPEALRRAFPTSHDVAPEWHVRMQAAFQRHCDSGVSKTVNLPRAASKTDVASVFTLAWKLKCKGITVYRDGSLPGQVLTFGGRRVVADAHYSGGCEKQSCAVA